MNKLKSFGEKFIPGKFEKLISMTEKIDNLQYKLNDLAEEVMIDIIDGWTTGDKMLDFILVACNGVYDPFVICMQYRRIQELGLRKLNQNLLIIQTAERFDDENELIVLRNVFLVTLRKDTIEFDVDNLSMRIPVEPGYFLWREVLKEGFLVSGYRIFNDNWITTGPIFNQYCNYGAISEDDDETLFVPNDAVCDIELLPLEDRDSLYHEHEITAEALDYFYRTWVRAKTKSISLK